MKTDSASKDNLSDTVPPARSEPEGAEPVEAGAAEGDLAGELERVRDRYLRLAAEYDNFRKRSERERSESWTRARADLASSLLDALDDLRRVSEHDPGDSSASSLHEGVRLVERKLLQALEAAGLEEVDAEGSPFDPEVHEALMTVPAGEPGDDGLVEGVLQRGYRFRGALLRPARVRVWKYEE
ncbi:MAG: nucleotide exchange factor GrpE [Longimicrobiaceae bacterium]